MGNETSRREVKNHTPLNTVGLLVKKIGALRARWWEQPIGVIVPLVALIILVLAPQSADMFAAIDGWLSATGFAFAAFTLAFSSWYWTRAGLLVLDERGRDHARWLADRASRWERREKPLADWGPKEWEEWSDEWAPRVAVGFALLIAATPIVVLIFGKPFTRTVFFFPLVASILGILAVILVYAVAVKWETAEGERSAVERGEERWEWETTSVFAAAPFGPRWALMSLALSVLGVIAIAARPGWVDHIDAPTAALFALALVIPLLVMALAFTRDIVRVAVTVILFVWNRFFQTAKLEWETLWTACTARELRSLTASLGLFLLAVIIFMPYVWSGQRGLYEVRTAGALPETRREEGQDTSRFLDQPRPTMKEALENWHRARLDAGHPPDRPMPAIIVAASGGASRAALWLLSSMQMLDEKTSGAFGRYLFAISSVSGGSLGAVTYLQTLRQYPRTIESGSGPIVDGLDWEKTQEKLNGFRQSDLLVASISTYFLNDAIRPVIYLVPGINLAALLPDRGEALERAFERHWSGLNRLAIPEDQANSGLIELWQGGGRGMPHLLLNGTDVDSGRRLITSTIRFTSQDDLFAGSDDLLMLLGHDVPASTAVTNSARFPFISPAGRFWADGRPRQVVDGGYFENYGARTAAELADKVEQISPEMADEARKAGQPMAPIVPILVVVSNDAEALRSAEDVQACTSEDANDACRTLEEATVSCVTPLTQGETQKKISEKAQQAAIARDPRGGGFGPEFLAPLLGLNATRGAHGRDALYIMRHHYCPVEAQEEKKPAEGASPAARIESLPRMVQIALPRPKPEAGESAPLNWVLNNSAVDFLRAASGFDFNGKQAELLRATLHALLEGEPATPEASPVSSIGGSGGGK